jgi:membrane-bound serine protease (ClpP class)
MMLVAGIAGLFLLDPPWNVLAVSVAAVIEVGEIYFWIRFLRRYRVQTGVEGMIGERGEVIAAFGDGEGRVRAHGEIWAAHCRAEVAMGERVRIVAVDGLTLEVEPETEKGP